MRQSTRMILNSACMYGAKALNMGLQIVLLAFIIRRVDEVAYGVFALAFGLEQVLFILRDAVAKGCVTHVARYWEEKRPEAINQIVSSASAGLLIPGAVTLVVVALAAGPLTRFLDVAPSLRDTAQIVLILAGVNLSFVLPLYPLVSVVEARQRYDLIALVNMVFRLTRAGVIVASFLVFEPNIIFLAIATMLADIGSPAVLGLLAHRLVPSLRLRPRFITRTALFALLAFGSFIIYGSLTRIGAQEASKWIVGKMLGISFVTFLVFATYLMNVLKQASLTMTLVIVPVASQYHARKDEKTLGELLIRSTRYGSLATWPIAAAIAPMMGSVFALWLKPDLAWLGPYGAAVGICGALFLPSNGALQVVLGMGHSKPCFLSAAAGGILGLIVTTITIGLLDWGLTGAVLGTCVWLAVSAIGYTASGLRRIRVSPWRFFREGYLQPILPAIPAGLACGTVRYFWGAGSWLHILSGAAAAGVVYVLCFLPFVTRAEWDLIRRGRVWLQKAQAKQP